MPGMLYNADASDKNTGEAKHGSNESSTIKQGATGVIFNKSNFLLTLFSTFIGFVITYFLLGMYYVDYEGIADGLISGKLTPGFPFRSLHFLGLIGTSYLYSYLNQVFPSVDWMSAISCIYLLISTFIGLYIVAALLPEKTPKWVKVVLQIAIFLLIYSDAYTHFLETRVSYTICGSCLVALIFLFNSTTDIKSRLGLFILLNLFFTVGTLTRVESSVACLSLAFVFGVFYFQSIKHFVLVFLYPSLLAVSMLTYITYEIKTATQYYEQVEPDIESQYIERKNLEPISYMQTHRDSVLYNVASNFIWSDPKVFTPKYLRSLILPENFLFTDKRQWQRVYNDLTDVAQSYWYLTWMSVLLAFVIFLQFNYRKIIYGWLRWLGFELGFWGLLCLQTYLVKVNDRSFLPFINLFIFMHLLLIIKHATTLRFRVYPFLFIVLLLVARQFYYLKTSTDTLRTYLISYQKNLAQIKKAAAGKYLVVNSSSADFLLLSSSPFHPFDFSDFKKVYIVDGYIIPFLPYYRSYLENECHCDIYAYPSFLHYLRSIHNQVVIVSDSHRFNLTNAYLQEMYHEQLPVKQESITLTNPDSHNYAPNIQLYTLTN